RDGAHEVRPGADDVPAGVILVPDAVGGVHLAVEPHVFAIDVARDVRVRKDVIERSVEFREIGLAATRNLNPVEDGVPLLGRRLLDGFEIPAGVLLVKVRLRVGDTHVREANLGLYDVIRTRIERHEAARGRSGRTRRSGRYGATEPGAEFAIRPVED